MHTWGQKGDVDASSTGQDTDKCICRRQNFYHLSVSRQGFAVALEPVLELALVAQAGLELTELCLSLPPKC